MLHLLLELRIAKLTKKSNLNKATVLAENLLGRLSVNTDKEIKSELYYLLYRCYKDQNKLEKSLEMHELFTVYNDSIQDEKNKFSVIREAVKNDFELQLYETKLENERRQSELKIFQLKRTFAIVGISVLIIVLFTFYFIKQNSKSRKIRDRLLHEIELLKKVKTPTIVNQIDNKFSLDRNKIEKSIDRKLNDTDWNVLNILSKDPVLTNRQIAEKAFKSIDGIGSSLRRMYNYFEIQDTKYKKIALISEVIKRSNTIA